MFIIFKGIHKDFICEIKYIYIYKFNYNLDKFVRKLRLIYLIRKLNRYILNIRLNKELINI